MTSTRRVLHGAAALVALAAVTVAPGVAEAQDAKPVIREVQMNRKRVAKAPLGGVITLIGSGFPADDADGKHPDGLTVSIGGDAVILLGAQADAVTVLIPQFGVSTGRKKVKVSVRGRGDAEADIELLDPQEYQKQMRELIDATKATESGGAGGAQRGPDVEDLVMASFKIDRFELKRDASGARFEAEGSAGELPDGFQINLFLNINETRELEAQKVAVRGKTWRVTFGPYTRQVLYGNYSLNLLFELNKQPRVLARRFREKLDPNLQAVYDRIFRREFVTVGTDQELADQRAALQAHYRQLCEETTKLLLEVEKAYASASRVFFRPQGGQGFNENEHAAYVQQMRIAKDTKELEAIKNDWRFAQRTGHFKADDYAKWAETTLIPAIQAQSQKHHEFRDSTMKPVDERANMIGDYMISIVFEMFREYSRVLYERSKVELPELFRSSPIDAVSAPTISRPFFEAQRRLVLRSVGLGNLIPPGEGDNDADQPKPAGG